MKKNEKRKCLCSIVILSILLIVFWFSACEKYEEIGTIIAEVNGHRLTIEQLRESYGDQYWDSLLPDEQREIINQWVELTLLYSRALNQDVFNDDIALDFMAQNAEKRIYANALISHELHNLTFSNEEMYNYYRLREAEFTEQIREFRVQRIFLNDEVEMENVKRMLDNREIQFTTAAIRFSQEPIGRNGGDMPGFITKVSPDSLLWEELNRVGQFTEISMPLNNGWVIARWREFRMATTSRSFYSVRDEIEEIMREEKKLDLYEKVLLDARRTSRVTIFQ
ncbi:MAG: hypothetical protein FWG98_08085 [Candidatus Cloacimonetes bacterium]|nr:hypothetical protein [Candidatus Cloacimonadota bacterium]